MTIVQTKTFFVLVRSTNAMGIPMTLFAQPHNKRPEFISAFGTEDVTEACRFGSRDYAERVAGKNSSWKVAEVTISSTIRVEAEEEEIMSDHGVPCSFEQQYGRGKRRISAVYSGLKITVFFS